MINARKQDDRKQLSQWAVAIFAIIIMLIAADIWGDYQDGIAWRHVIVEMMILVVALVGVVYFGGLYYLVTQSKIDVLARDLNVANGQAQHWREANRDLIAGLSKQIFKQFNAWQLTQAEMQVGILMLKGLSHQEIAVVRATSERTVRDQARAVYRKSGVAGRSELSAFFLEDLLPPHGDV